MTCKFCGTELKDDALFCASCGKAVVADSAEAAPAAPVAPAAAPIITPTIAAPAAPEAPEKKKKLDYNKLCLILGTIIIIIGVIRLLDSSTSISSASFGADFYTYSYKGIVACAEMLGKINRTLSWGLIGFGAFIDLKAIKEHFNK